MWFEKYNKGTAPQGAVTQEEVDTLIALFHSTYDQLLKDYQNGVFQSYEAYTTSTKMELKNVEDAITFSLFHEGIHVGSVLALAKHV